MKKLFLLDAYALIYRAYYALIRAPRITSKGFNTSAIFGFVNTLEDLLRKENPTHIAVCFDPKGPTFRHDVYPQYKAQREAQPEDITLSIPYIKDIIRAFNIPVFEIPGYEADDVIGTISRMAAAEGFDTYMMTPDKDYGQLVNEHVKMYRPSLAGKGFEIRGVAEICEKYGISNPLQVIDLLALEGDTADNVPGCPGVGPKTASKLIAEYSSVESLLENADKIKGAVGQKIRDNAEQIKFSKYLVTIKTDVPVEVNFDELQRRPEDQAALYAIYNQLEFKSFLSRLSPEAATAALASGKYETLGGNGSNKTNGTNGKPAPNGANGNPAPNGANGNASPKVASTTVAEAEAEASKNGAAKKPAKQPATDLSQLSLFDFMDGTPDEPEQATKAEEIPVSYATLAEPSEVEQLVKEALSKEHAGIALYAVGQEAMTADLRGVAIATTPGAARYVKIPQEVAARKALLQLLQPLFAAPTTVLVSHDIKRDMVLLRREGIEITAKYYDTQLAHYILQPEMRHRLANIVMNLLGISMAEYTDASAARKQYGAMPPEDEQLRICQQADMVLRICPQLTKLLEQNAQKALLDDIELPLAAVLADMEWEGVRIDVPELNKLSASLTAQLRDIEEKIYELAGERFNIASPMQVGEVLFGKLQLDAKAKRTKTGAYSTTEEVLMKHQNSHPIVGLIIQARGLRKLLTTYVDALPTIINPKTGKIHTTFNQTVTATGRISSANPNLQNIPIRTEDGKEVRRAFIADPGCVILSADYSQIELRLLTILSNDPELTEAFNSGLDIHRATAAKIYHLPYDEVSDDQRRKAKTANFGTIYGISAFGLAERLNIPRYEAKELIEGYFATYPHIRQFIDESVSKARQDGYVSTVMGRKRFLPDINSRNATVRSFAERNAVNAPLQGSAADIIKLAMIRVQKLMKQLQMRSRMILQVHDELIFNVYPEELAQLQQLVIREMSGAFSGSVPLEVSAGIGNNWLEAH
jgi:DNA polymerase-1